MLLNKIGRGTYGDVFVASDGTVHKRLHTPDDPTTLLNELAVLLYSNSPHLVRGKKAFLDHQTGQPVPVFIMEHGGSSLEQWLNKRQVTADNCAMLMRQIMRGLQDLHQCGIVHCDMKTANVLVEARGRVRLGDFGLARSVHQLEDDRHLVSRWQRCPELEAAGIELGPGIDVWAAGCIWANMLLVAFDDRHYALFPGWHSTFTPLSAEQVAHYARQAGPQWGQRAVIFGVLRELYRQQHRSLALLHAAVDALQLPPGPWADDPAVLKGIPRAAPPELLQLLLEMVQPLPAQRWSPEQVLAALHPAHTANHTVDPMDVRASSPPPEPELYQCMDLSPEEANLKLRQLLSTKHTEPAEKSEHGEHDQLDEESQGAAEREEEELVSADLRDAKRARYR